MSLRPTRWLVRTDAINDRLSQYNGVLDTLYKLAESGSSLAGIANDLRQIDQAASVLAAWQLVLSDLWRT